MNPAVLHQRPLPALEKEARVTRRALGILMANDLTVTILTKGEPGGWSGTVIF